MRRLIRFRLVLKGFPFLDLDVLQVAVGIGIFLYFTLVVWYTPSIIHQMWYNVEVTHSELLVLGITGLVFTITLIASVSPGTAAFSIALAGLRHSQRNFLLPCIVFLIVNIIVDVVNIFSIFFLDWYPSNSTTAAICELVKLVASVLVGRALLNHYRVGVVASATK